MKVLRGGCGKGFRITGGKECRLHLSRDVLESKCDALCEKWKAENNNILGSLETELAVKNAQGIRKDSLALFG